MSTIELPILVKTQTGVQSIEVLLPEVSLKGDSTRSFHYRTFPGASKWKTWCDEASTPAYRRARLLYARQLSEAGATEIDKTAVEQELSTLNTAINRGDVQMTIRSAGDHDKNAAIEQKMATEKTPTKWTVFGLWLPSRRTDIAELVITNGDVPENGVNYYDQKTSTFVFTNYKTKGTYGVQRFVLEPKTFPMVEPSRVAAAKKFLDDCKPGPLIGSRNFNRDMKNYTGFVSNDYRHFWVTRTHEMGSRDKSLKLSNWMAHSPTTALVHYCASLSSQSSSRRETSVESVSPTSAPEPDQN